MKAVTTSQLLKPSSFSTARKTGKCSTAVHWRSSAPFWKEANQLRSFPVAFSLSGFVMLPVAVILLMCEPILSKLNCNVNAYIRMYHHESQHAVDYVPSDTQFTLTNGLLHRTCRATGVRLRSFFYLTSHTKGAARWSFWAIIICQWTDQTGCVASGQLPPLR